jgi:polyhydroxyalkanoic acid synthase PhaR subunit
VYVVPQQTKPGSNSDATALWRQWYDNATKVWTNTLGGAGEAYLDPFGIYRQWLKSAEESQGHAEPAARQMDPVELWKEWFDAAAGMWRTVAGSTPSDPLGLTTQWLEMVEETRAKAFSKDGPPLDPLSFFREWYDKTSETWSTVIGDAIGTEAFIQSASRFLDSYTSYYRTLRQTAETQLHNMQMPTRSDIARVAGLVVALEDKVDQLQDAFDAHADEQAPQAPTLDAVTALDKRISSIETKLDALLSSLARLETDSRAAAAREHGQDSQAQNGGQPARRAPAQRARRTSAASAAATRAGRTNESRARRGATKKGPEV